MAPYFAFASNLNRALMRERCPRARPLERAYIADHRLGFAGHSDLWDGPTATILLSPGEKLWGALYDVDEECLRVLAAKEGPAYALSRTGCLTESGARASTYLFVRVRDFEERPPSERYVAAIRQGYMDWGLDLAALDRSVDRTGAARINSEG